MEAMTADETPVKLFDAGIVPASSDVGTYCTNAAMADKPYADKCTPFLDREKLIADMETKCQDKAQCEISPLDQYVRFDDPAFDAEECSGDTVMMFA